jgi:hypothetical protein
MNEETQKLIDKFLQECSSVDVFGYTLGVFIAHRIDSNNVDSGNFRVLFDRFNMENGVRFSFQNLTNNMVAISEY